MGLAGEKTKNSALSDKAKAVVSVVAGLAAAGKVEVGTRALSVAEAVAKAKEIVDSV